MPEGISPQLLKGALAIYQDEQNGTPDYVIFQYNPEQVRRTLALRAPPDRGQRSSPGPAREDVRRAAGPPLETINLSIQLNAAEQIARRDQAATQDGLHPLLAKLEMLLYPPTATLDQNEQLASQGQVQINPASVPLVVLIWGRSRVVPVAITSFGAVEEAFDQNLNPIQAKVDLGLKVLTYLELSANTIGRRAYVAYQRHKEELARQYRASDDRVSGLAPR
jgi:hypothetical protein